MSVVDQLAEALNAHDLDGAVALFHPRYRSEQPLHPARAFVGRDQVRANWDSMLAGIPDFHAAVHGLARTGETTWVDWAWSGTRTDGQPFRMAGVCLFEIREGRIEAGRLYMEEVDRGDVGIDEAVEHLSGHTRRRADDR